MHLFSPWHIVVLLLTVGFTVLVAVALVVFIRSAAARSRQAGGPVPVVRPAAERLAELDDLLQRGTITAQEHSEARARILAEV